MNTYLDFIKRVMAVAHTGVSYSTDPYALENYEELLELSKTMLHQYSNQTIEAVDLYQGQRYPTPQPTVRVLIVKDGQFCMVKEKYGPAKDQWSLPGGWCDIGKSPVEAALAEGQEESGIPIRIVRLLAVMDRRFYMPSDIYSTYTLVFLAEPIGEASEPNFEITAVDWFSLDTLPHLSFKATKEELLIMVDAYKNGSVYIE
jgi:8-oxo-dGTP diphosphatase